MVGGTTGQNNGVTANMTARATAVRMPRPCTLLHERTAARTELWISLLVRLVVDNWLALGRT